MAVHKQCENSINCLVAAVGFLLHAGLNFVKNGNPIYNVVYSSYLYTGWMDDMRFSILFNSISVISG